MLFDNLLQHILVVHFHWVRELLLGLEVLIELVFIVDDIPKDSVRLEEGHEPNESQLLEVVLVFRIEVDVHLHGLDSLRYP